MQAKETLEVASVFYVPKLPGRVYFEARSSEAVKALCEGLVFLYFRSHVFVPITERVALLEVGKSDPLIEEGTLVKVKDGMYRNNLAIVVSVIGNHDAVVLKLQSREKLPNVPKRKRGHTQRDAYLLTKEKAAALSEGGQVKETDDGFIFQGKSYTKDGHLLLQIRCDRVERISTGIVAHELFVASESANAAEQHFEPPKIVTGKDRDKPRDSFIPKYNAVSIPRFLNIGDHVSITDGASAGARGIINELSPDYALVTLDEEWDEFTKIEPVLTEIEHITRVFDYGERVQVKVGTFAGRSGVVGNIDGLKKILHIIDRERNEVASSFFFY